MALPEHPKALLGSNTRRIVKTIALFIVDVVVSRVLSNLELKTDL